MQVESGARDWKESDGQQDPGISGPGIHATNARDQLIASGASNSFAIGVEPADKQSQTCRTFLD